MMRTESKMKVYTCLDCRAAWKRIFLGKCPRCGSSNVQLRSEDKVGPETKHEEGGVVVCK